MKSLQAIIEEIEENWLLRPGSVLQSTRGSPRLVRARHVAMYLYWLQDKTRTFTHIGQQFRRHRSVASGAIHRVASDLKRGKFDVVFDVQTLSQLLQIKES